MAPQLRRVIKRSTQLKSRAHVGSHLQVPPPTALLAPEHDEPPHLVDLIGNQPNIYYMLSYPSPKIHHPSFSIPKTKQELRSIKYNVLSQHIHLIWMTKVNLRHVSSRKTVQALHLMSQTTVHQSGFRENF